jgi:hypothetical protein
MCMTHATFKEEKERCDGAGGLDYREDLFLGKINRGRSLCPHNWREKAVQDLGSV